MASTCVVLSFLVQIFRAGVSVEGFFLQRCVCCVLVRIQLQVSPQIQIASLARHDANLDVIIDMFCGHLFVLRQDSGARIGTPSGSILSGVPNIPLQWTPQCGSHQTTNGRHA